MNLTSRIGTTKSRLPYMTIGAKDTTTTPVLTGGIIVLGTRAAPGIRLGTRGTSTIRLGSAG